jgi:hypothetical protein
MQRRWMPFFIVPGLTGSWTKGYSKRGRVEEEVDMDSVRRTMLKTGAAATAVAAAPGVFAQQAEQADTFYENGSIHIHFEQTGLWLSLVVHCWRGIELNNLLLHPHSAF